MMKNQPSAGKKPRTLLDDDSRDGFAHQIKRARDETARRTGCPSWDFQGIRKCILKAESVWESWPDLYAAGFTVAANPAMKTPAAIASRHTTLGPTPAAVEAAAARSKTYDMPCPDHPDRRGRCPECSTITPAPRPANWQDLVEAGRASRAERQEES